ncbi:hypothetical protein ACTHQY_14990 [Rhodococcoides corynebacterioides]|uniref:hypothetical protein n=1 Tax=Rhodococcoides corynebacterioides TaxID=53972 RepID=UPI003F7E6DF0
MRSSSGETDAWQTPRICSAPAALSSSGQDAVDLAASAGLHLDPWQRNILDVALREKPDGKWSSFEVGVLVSRQNGKGAIIEARELAGIFLFGERLIIHSAHQFDTSLEAFRRLRFWIENTPDLDRQVKKINEAHGKEGIELKNGNRIRFRARTRSGGRGFSGDTVILDEAMILPEESVGALLPTMSARPNAQLWYLGSAVDEEIHEHGMTFTRIRNRGVAGGDPSLAYIEHSADDTRRDDDSLIIDPADPRQIMAANPGIGYRLTLSHIAKERRSMPSRMYLVERLGIGFWPTEDSEKVPPINPETWQRRSDKAPGLTQQIAIAVDMDPELRWCSIAAAVLRTDGGVHVEVGYHEKPSRAVVPYLIALIARWNPVALVIDSKGSAAYLRPLLMKEKIQPEDVTGASMAQACVGMQRAVDDDDVSHTGDPVLIDAVKGAKKRRIGDGWGFDRKGDSIISPLVAVTLARHGLLSTITENPPPASPDFDTAETTSAGDLVDDMLTAGF